MRKSIGTLVGAVAISLCIVFSFYSAAQGEKQRKDLDRMLKGYAAIGKPTDSRNRDDRLSDTFTKGRTFVESGS